jgi:hypothetical protein
LLDALFGTVDRGLAVREEEARAHVVEVGIEGGRALGAHEASDDDLRRAERGAEAADVRARAILAELGRDRGECFR